MRMPSRPRTWLLALALLAPALPAAAAPAPAPRPSLDKYLPDDADFVLVVNVKQIVASPLFTRHYEKQVRELLKAGPAQVWLEGTGFDPLKDAERLIVVTGRSLHDPEHLQQSGPLVYLQGRFDPDKLRATADKLAEVAPGQFKAQTLDGVKGYHLSGPGPSGFVCLLDRHTLLFAPAREGVIAGAAARLAGKKKPELKHKALRPLLDKMKPEQAVSFVALGDMVVGSGVSVRSDGMGGTTRTVKHHTLAEQGIDSIEGGITVAEDAAGRATLTVKDEEEARRMAKAMTDGLNAAMAEIRKVAKEEPTTWAAVINALQGVRIRASGRTVVLEGRASAEGIKGLITGALYGVSSKPRKATPPARP